MSTKLPVRLTRFVGREAELAEAAALLAENRLLTLIGPGGAGKTRLALQLASEVAGDFPDGVCFVDFSPLSSGEFVWDQVGMSLGVREPGPGRTWADALGRHLGSRQTLVVFDNCEHLVQAAAEVTDRLLSAAADLRVIATSREPLEVAGEVTWAVPPLSDRDAIQLFSDRARRAQPRFRLSDEDAEAMRSICRSLDGLPLAIELAAARTRALAPAQIAAQLRDQLRVLPSGPRTAPSRQSTLRGSFEWSYNLLAEPECALLRELSVFAGAFDLEAALAVCPAASVELLAALVDRSLISIDDRSDEAEPRYRMLETIREFAAERMAAAGEMDPLHTRHRDHYLALAETVHADFYGPDQVRGLARVRAEQDNLRAALAWSRDQGDAEALVRLVVALGPCWGAKGRYREFQIWSDAADRAENVLPGLQAQLRNLECFFAILGGPRLQEVPALANEALALARAAGDQRAEAIAMGSLGFVAGLAGGAEAMRPYIEEAVVLTRSTGFALLPIASLLAFVFLRMFQSRPEETRRLAVDAVGAVRAVGESHIRLSAWYIAGLEALIRGQLADAMDLFEAALADGRKVEDTVVWNASLGIAWVALFRGDFASARAAVAEAVAAAESSEADSGSVLTVQPISWWILAWMELASGDAARARDLLASPVEFLRKSRMARWAAVPLVVMAEAQLALGDLAEAEATLDQAVALARSGAMTWALGRAGLVGAKLRARQGNPQEAESLTHEALSLGREAGDQMGLVSALELLAWLAAEQDSNREAVRLWAAADSQRTRIGYARFPVERGPHEAAVAAASEALGPDDFAAAWAEGAKLSAEEAIAYAARGRGERRRPTTGWSSLTPSELEVVRLVGDHLSNPQIAARLFVSRATVKTHLVHIFTSSGSNPDQSWPPKSSSERSRGSRPHRGPGPDEVITQMAENWLRAMRDTA